VREEQLEFGPEPMPAPLVPPVAERTPESNDINVSAEFEPQSMPAEMASLAVRVFVPDDMMVSWLFLTTKGEPVVIVTS
jgi:hypothetical protein